MPRKGTPMTEMQKQFLSEIQKKKRRKAEKYAKHLGLPVNEVMHNLPYLEKTFSYRQIQSLTQSDAHRILMEGNWKENYTWPQMLKANNEQQSDYVKSSIKQELLNKEKYDKERAANLGIPYKKLVKEVKEVGYNYQDKPNDPSQDLKVAFWFINKMGGIEKAKKIFEAAKLAIEAMKS